MGTDTYLSIVFGDILLFVISIIGSNIEARKAKHVSKGDHRYRCLLLLSLCVFILVTSIFLVTRGAEKKKAFRQTMEQAYSQMNSMNYLEAASFFDQATRMSYDAESFCEACYYQGANYFIYAISENDSVFYHRAAKCFLEILEHYSIDSSEYYVDAVSGLCGVYRGLNYDPQNPDYQHCVKWLEENIDFSNNDGLSHAMNAQKLSAANALGRYYMDLADGQIDPHEKSESSAKAVEYYLAYVDLLRKDPANAGVKSWGGSEFECFINIADCLISMSLDSNNSQEILNAAKEMAEDMLTNIPDGENRLKMYYDLVICVSKADLTYGVLFHDDSRKEEAYNRIKQTFGFKVTNSIDKDRFLAYYIAAHTGLCTEEEINAILDFCEQPENNTAENTQQRISFLRFKLNLYKTIIEDYSYTTNAVQLGKEAISELSSYYDILSETDKELFNEFEEYFTSIIR